MNHGDAQKAKVRLSSAQADLFYIYMNIDKMYSGCYIFNSDRTVTIEKESINAGTEGRSSTEYTVCGS